MVYSNATIIAIILGFFALGYLFNNLLRKILDVYNEKNYKKEINDIFQGILDNIYTQKTSFNSRINNTVSVMTELENLGSINIVYLMDRKDIAVFKGDKCIYTSDSAEKTLVEEIIMGVEIFYKHEINDVVNVMGMVFSRDEFEKKFGVKVEDIKKGNFRGLKEEMSDIEKIKKRNSVKFNIDEILDRISSVGIENLTPEERNFLDNYNNE
jgi:hypothetical protein